MENLLTRMELYANNLEFLVQERTHDYLIQKQRVEDLLYMMMPEDIARVLIGVPCSTCIGVLHEIYCYEQCANVYVYMRIQLPYPYDKFCLYYD